jgi:hypothetical protein
VIDDANFQGLGLSYLWVILAPHAIMKVKVFRIVKSEKFSSIFGMVSSNCMSFCPHCQYGMYVGCSLV